MKKREESLQTSSGDSGEWM